MRIANPKHNGSLIVYCAMCGKKLPDALCGFWGDDCMECEPQNGVYYVDDEWRRRFPEMNGHLVCLSCAYGNSESWLAFTCEDETTGEKPHGHIEPVWDLGNFPCSDSQDHLSNAGSLRLFLTVQPDKEDEPSEAELDLWHRMQTQAELQANPASWRAWVNAGKPQPPKSPGRIAREAQNKLDDDWRNHRISLEEYMSGPVAEHDVFYIVRDPVAETVKFGITSGDGKARLRTHASNGYTEVVSVAARLDGTIARDTERLVRATLLADGFRPVSGNEYFEGAALGTIARIASKYTGMIILDSYLEAS